MTLEEKIKGMSTEQLADFLNEVTRNCSCTEDDCKKCLLRSSTWICDRQSILESLKEEVKE